MRAAALALLLAAAPAAAQPACAPTEAVAAMLARDWGEARRFAGLDGRGAAVELWVAPSGSWTLLIVSPGGTACLLASGTAGAVLPPLPAGVPG